MYDSVYSCSEYRKLLRYTGLCSFWLLADDNSLLTHVSLILMPLLPS